MFGLRMKVFILTIYVIGIPFSAALKLTMQSGKMARAHTNRGNIAVCFYGWVASGHKLRKKSDPKSLNLKTIGLKRVRESVVNHLVTPTTRDGFNIDFFAQTWDLAMSSIVNETFQPVAMDVQEQGSLTVWDGHEKCVHLRKKYEQQEKKTYMWQMNVRYDISFFTDFRFLHLNSNLFYASNWCKAAGPTWLMDIGNGQIRCASHFGRYVHDALQGLPDFWFAGSPSNMDLVFYGMPSAFSAHIFSPSASSYNHAVIGGRIQQLLHSKKLPGIGRYLIHHFDYDIIREIDQTRLDVIDRNMTWQGTPPQLPSVGFNSTCSAIPTYCSPHWHPGWHMCDRKFTHRCLLTDEHSLNRVRLNNSKLHIDDIDDDGDGSIG